MDTFAHFLLWYFAGCFVAVIAIKIWNRLVTDPFDRIHPMVFIVSWFVLIGMALWGILLLIFFSRYSEGLGKISKVVFDFVWGHLSKVYRWVMNFCNY